MYKLVFRGELIDGQHPAVVRRRLGEQLALDETRLDRLFSGQSVVVKAEADAEAAARLQALFRKAGARLRVQPLQPASGEAEAPGAVDAAPADAGLAEAGGGPDLPGTFDPEVLPVGSDVLREDEREPWCPRDIDTGHLELLEPGQTRDDPVPSAPPPPDTSRLRLVDP